MMRCLFSIVATFTCSLGAFTQGTVHVSNNTFLKSINGASIVVDNVNIVNNGMIDYTGANNAYIFIGNTTTDFSGSGTTILNRLIVNKTGSRLIFKKPISVRNEVVFTLGLIDLDNSMIDLGTTGVLTNESEGSRAFTTGTGYIQAISATPLNGSVAVNLGNLGAYITSTQNLGIVIIRRGHQSQNNPLANGSSMLRYYDILPTNNNNLDATLRFTYFDAELNGLTEGSLLIYKSPDAVNWTTVGFDTRSTATNTVEKSGVSGFDQRWTVSNAGGSVLPVTFMLFNGRCRDNTLELTWKVANELNIAIYVVEKSKDGINWTEIGSVLPVNDPAVEKTYKYTDPSNNGDNLYRIKAQDRNGKTTYSAVLRVKCGGENEFLRVWPNPVNDHLNLSIELKEPATAMLQLYDVRGVVVERGQKALLSGQNIMMMPTEKLAKGTYYLVVTWGSTVKTVKIIKQ